MFTKDYTRTIKIEYIFVILLILSLSFYYYSKTIFDFPAHVHRWTQAGYYTVALGFIDNDFNFFLPETNNLDPQFPGNRPLSERKGITSIDFPVHPYLVSIIMFITGNKSPVVFRVYNLIWGLTGMFFLFLIANKFTKSFLKSIFIVLFAFTSPVYLYYQNGFIPSIPSIASTIIGLFYFLKYQCSISKKDFIMYIIFFTIAVLARTPFFVFLFTSFLLTLFKWIKERKALQYEILCYFGSFTFIASCFFYNKLLASKYGTMFLARFLPAENINEFKMLFSTTLGNWKYDFFTKWHYYAFLLVFVLSLFFFFKKKSELSKIKNVFQYFFISFSGFVLYFIMMQKQFVHHDYYFLDSFFITLLLLFVGLIYFIPIKTIVAKTFFTVSTILLFAGFLTDSQAVQEKRRLINPWDRGQIIADDFYGGWQFLDSLHVPADAKLLVIETYDPYSSLIHLRRKGFTAITTDTKTLSHAFSFDYDFVAMPNDFSISDVVRNYPTMINYLEKVGDNGKISIYKKVDFKKEKSIYEFLGIISSTVFVKKEDSDSLGERCGVLNDSTEFSRSFSFFSGEIGLKGQEKIFISTDICFPQEENNLQLVCTVRRKNETLYYAYFPIINKKQEWQKEEQQFRLPENILPDDEIVIYLWNAGKTPIKYYNREIIIYR